MKERWTEAKRNQMNKLQPYFWVSPSFLVLFLLTIIPVILLVYISFTSFEIGYPWAEREYIGIENYLRLFEGKEVEFWPSVKLSLFVVAVTVGATLILGLAIALLFNRRIKFEYIFMAMLLMPIAVNPAIAGLMWKLMFSYDFGIINVFLEKIAGYKNVWLGQSYALFSTLMVLIWMRTPLSVLMMLAGLQGIDLDSIEAAKVDGASAGQILIRIILPQLKAVIVITCIFQAILALQTFGPIFTLTRGGPGISTTILSLFVYRTGFRFSMMGIAAAGAIVLVAISLILSLAMMKSGNET